MHQSSLRFPLFFYVSLIWEAIEKPYFDNICVTSSNSDLPDLLNQRIYLRVDQVVLAKVHIVQNLQIKMQFYLLKSKLTAKGIFRNISVWKKNLLGCMWECDTISGITGLDNQLTCVQILTS